MIYPSIPNLQHLSLGKSFNWYIYICIEILAHKELIERKTSQETHCDAFEVDSSVICVVLVVEYNCISEHRNVMTSIVFTSYKEIAGFILGESLKPVYKESISVVSCVSVPGKNVVA
jgi:hypothetical protein